MAKASRPPPASQVVLDTNIHGATQSICMGESASTQEKSRKGGKSFRDFKSRRTEKALKNMRHFLSDLIEFLQELNEA
jgi:hypothetical protein